MNLRVTLVAPGHAVAEVGGEARRGRSAPRKWPSSVTPMPLQRPQVEVVARRRARWPGRWRPGGRPGPAASSTVSSRKPVSSAHQTTSWSPIRRGIHGARPHARKTSRPASWSSSAIWQPDWPLPTTSTWPGAAARRGCGSPRRRSGAGRRAASPLPAGRCGRWYAPVASTTVRARCSPVRRPSTKPPSAPVERRDLDALAHRRLERRPRSARGRRRSRRAA